MSKNSNNNLVGTFFRRLRWAFSKSGMLSLALEHFLAMVPSTILVPILINNTTGAHVADVSLVLFSSGIGTILFTIVSKGKIPAYIGSSFAYIGITVYLIEEQKNASVTPDIAYLYVVWGYLFSGIILMALSFLYTRDGIEKVFAFLLPPTIVGPAISLIGLELADTAIVDSGFDISAGLVDSNAALVSMITLFVIIIFSLIKHKILKNSAIIIGVAVGWLLYSFLYDFPKISFDDVNIISFPNIKSPFTVTPPNLPSLFFVILPATFIVFTENIGHVTLISRMINDKQSTGTLYEKKSMQVFRSALLSHGIATTVSALFGSVPNTIYAENIAVMGLHKTNAEKKDPDFYICKMLNPCSVLPYIFAAIFAIIFSFIGPLQSIIMSIPKPIIGGMELFLFGIISAPGIQILVEQRVNYQKISNQIITAAVLISGISGLSINIGFVDLKGMSLGFVVGIVLNLIVQAIKHLGKINDIITFDEVLMDCMSVIDKHSRLMIKNNDLKKINEKLCKPFELYTVCLSNNGYHLDSNQGTLSSEYLLSTLTSAKRVEITLDETTSPIITIQETANGITIDINKNVVEQNFDSNTLKKYLNDYEDALDLDSTELHIYASKSIPKRTVKTILKLISSNYINNP